MSHLEAHSKTKSNVKTEGEEQVFSNNSENNDGIGVKDIANRSGESSLERIKEMQKGNKMEREDEKTHEMKKEDENEMKKENENEMKKENENEMKKENENEMGKENEMKKENENEMKKEDENEMKMEDEMKKENENEMEKEDEIKKENENEMEKEDEIKKENEMKKENENEMKKENENEVEKGNEMEKENKNEMKKENENKMKKENKNEMKKEKENEMKKEMEIETGHGKESEIEGDARKKKEQNMKKAEVSSRLDPDPETDTGTGTGISTSVKEESNGDESFNKTNACGNDGEDDGYDGYDGYVGYDQDAEGDIDDNDNSDDDDDSNQSEGYNNMSDYDEPGMYGNESELKKTTRASQAQKKKIHDMQFEKNKEKTKDDANAKYNKGDYEGAVEIWERGLRSIDYVLSKRDELTKDKIKSFEKLHSIYCSNIAQGYMKLNNYSKCVKYSLQALEYEKENEKIYFRLAKGYFLLGEYDKAIKVLQDALQKKEVPALVNLLVVVKKKKELHLVKEKFMMQHIFQSLQKNPLTSNCDENGYCDNIKKRAVDLFGKLSCQIHYFISFIMLLVSLVFNYCYDCFRFVMEKSKLKKK